MEAGPPVLFGLQTATVLASKTGVTGGSGSVSFMRLLAVEISVKTYPLLSFSVVSIVPGIGEREGAFLSSKSSQLVRESVPLIIAGQKSATFEGILKMF